MELVDLARWGKLYEVQTLIEQGVDVNTKNRFGQTALYRACEKGHTHVAQYLLDNGASVNFGAKPLIAAVRYNRYDCAKLLLQYNANVHCTNTKRETPMSVALQKRNYSIILLLLQYNAVSSPLTSDSAIQLLKYAGMNMEDPETIEKLVDEKIIDLRSESTFLAAFRFAFESGSLQLAEKMLLDDSYPKVEQLYSDAAYYSVINNWHSVLSKLIEKGVDVNGQTGDQTLLFVACERGYTQIVDLLLQHGADPNSSTSTVLRLGLGSPARLFSSSSSSRDLPVCCAVKKGYTDIVELLMKYGADANKKDQSGKSALIYSIETLASGKCKTSDVQNPLEEINRNILKCLLLAARDVNRLSESDGRNALHIASSFGMCDVVMKLIECGADSNQLTSCGKSALDFACENSHEAAVEILLKNGAKPNRESATTFRQSSYNSRKSVIPVLCTAAKTDSESMVRILVQYGADVNASDKKGNAALHFATSHSIIETLLNAGANVNAKNDNGGTVLSIVCEKRLWRQIDKSVVEMLLKYGADPNEGFPVVAACENNDLGAVQLLLAHGADANQMKKCATRKSCMVGSSPLYFACRYGNVAMVDCLLQSGADKTFTDSDGNSLLHLRVQRLDELRNSEKYDPTIALLLQHNAPVNTISRTGESPLYLACMKGLRGVVKQLLSCSRTFVGLTENCWNKYPLLIACQNKFRDIAVLLLERGANTDLGEDDQTPLKVAAANGDVTLVEKLITFEADVNQWQNVSDTALHAAVRQCTNFVNQPLVVRTLLKGGADVNVFNHRGETPLCLVCRSFPFGDAVNIDTVRTLLEYGADPNIGLCPPCRNWSSLLLRYNDVVELPPLLSATYRGNSELVLLLIKFGAKLNHSDRYGGTALHYAIGYEEMELGVCQHRLKSTSDCTSTMEILLSAGADVNALDKRGASPLFLACRRGKSELVNFLLSHGADPNKRIIDKLPIHVACNGQHYDSVKLLLEYKADVNACDKNGKTALHHAVRPKSESRFATKSDSDKRAALVQLLLEGGANVNTTSEDGRSPIYIVCSKGLTSIAKNMLEFGAVVDVNKGRKLPLIAACLNSHVSMVQLLLAHGADPNVPEPAEGDAPLHKAAATNNSALVLLLMKHGANVDVANSRGNTALHLAIQHYPKSSRYSNSKKDALIIDILLENKADVNKLNSRGVTPLCSAVARELIYVVCKMLQIYGGNPNAGSANNYPLVAACLKQNVKLVDMLLNHGADPNLDAAAASGGHGSSLKLPLFVAADKGNTDIIMSLLNAGASVSATDCEGRSAVYSAAESLSRSRYYSESEMNKGLSAVRLLLQHGANFNMLMPDGLSPLHMVIGMLPGPSDQYKARVLELLQLMVEHGAVLLDSFFQLQDISCQRLRSETLVTLATFDRKHKFIVDLFRAGAGFQLIESCCRDVIAYPVISASIVLCQAAVLAGYMPSAEELVRVQRAAAKESLLAGLLKQLMTWLNEDRQQVPSLFRQCRIAIRRQLSAAAQNRTILPAIDQLPLPNKLKLYLQFDGSLTEVDLTVNDEQQSQTVETVDYMRATCDYEYDSDFVMQILE